MDGSCLCYGILAVLCNDVVWCGVLCCVVLCCLVLRKSLAAECGCVCGGGDFVDSV